MRGAIVDCWNLKHGRVDQIRHALSQHAVEPISQVSEEAEDEWPATVEYVRELLAEYDFVLLHVGDEQKFKLEILNEICKARPVFCYSGGPVLPVIETHCETPGHHVLCGGSFGRRDAGSLPMAIVRWLDVLGPNPSATDAVAAWHEVRHIDPAKQKKIEELESRLANLLGEHKWSPEAEISPGLRTALQSWRNEPSSR